MCWKKTHLFDLASTEKQEEVDEEDDEEEEDDDYFEEAEEEFVQTMPTETTADLAQIENEGFVTLNTCLDIFGLLQYLVVRIHLKPGPFSEENKANFEVVTNSTRTGCTVTSPVPFDSLDNHSQDRDFLNYLPQGIQLNLQDEIQQYGIYLETKYPNEEDRHAVTWPVKISFGSMKVKETPILQYLSEKSNQFILIYSIDKEMRRNTGHSGLKTNRTATKQTYASPPPQQHNYYQQQAHYASPPPRQQQQQQAHYASPPPQQQQAHYPYA